jgi:hypothetical protein
MDHLQPHRSQQQDVEHPHQHLDEDQPARPPGEAVHLWGKVIAQYVQSETEAEDPRSHGNGGVEEPQADQQVGRGRQILLQRVGE